MSFDDKNISKAKEYRNLPIVPGIETADNNHRHPKAKSAARTTRMFEIHNNQLETRSVSGNAKK